MSHITAMRSKTGTLTHAVYHYTPNRTNVKTLCGKYISKHYVIIPMDEDTAIPNQPCRKCWM